MFVINSKKESYYEIKNSKFYSYIYKIDSTHDLNKYINHLKSKHNKASHFVYAYRIMNNNSCDEMFFDDGEPKNSAGAPILNVIKGYDLINVVIIVVRYFGGTKLGVGGLVKAYTQSSKKVLSKDNITKYIETKNYKFDISYENLSVVSILESKYNLKVNLSFNKNNIVTISFDAPSTLFSEIKKLFKL